jgi:mRNA interferase RelE/StbE
MYELIILPPAARFLKKLKQKPLKHLFQNTVDRIRTNPYIGELKTGDLSGIRCCDIYYNNTNYELAYTLIQNGKPTVVIVLAGTRQNFYDELKRYMKDL